MQKWAADASINISKNVLLQVNQAAVQSIGPAYLSVHLEQQKIEEITANLKVVPKDRVEISSKLECRLKQAQERKVQAEAELQAALAHVNSIRLWSSTGISIGIGRDMQMYEDAMRSMSDGEPGVLGKITSQAEAMVNKGTLKPGDCVEVERDGRMQRGQVKAADGDEYQVSMFRTSNWQGKAYQEGFDTSNPVLVTYPRVKLYAKEKHQQELSPDALELSKSRAAVDSKMQSPPPVDSPEHLALLYTDAERTLPMLHEMGDRIEKAVPGVKALVAPLKGEARACYKARDKYRGDNRKLTDLARMTLKCSTLTHAFEALRSLGSDSAADVVLIKNRLMLSFDATPTGGYRDMLLNLRHKVNGHIVEVQITLQPLLDIKAGGGHAAYQVARTHSLFERDTYRYEGSLSPETIENVRGGVVRELECQGANCGLTQHYDKLIAALQAPTCGIRELTLTACDWPEGKTVNELFDAVPASIRKLVVSRMKSGGALTEEFFLRHPNLKWFSCTEMHLTGNVPKTLPKRMTHFIAWGNKLEGEFPDIFEGMTELIDFEVTGGITGSIPPSLLQCPNLIWLLLQNNKLTGQVPVDALCKLTRLKTLKLHGNSGLEISKDDTEKLKKTFPEAELTLP